MNLNKTARISKKPGVIWFCAVLIVVGFSRYIPLNLPNFFNFSPVLAIFLVSGMFLRGWISLLVPITAILLSDFALSGSYEQHFIEPFMFLSLFCYCLIFFYGKRIVKNKSPLIVVLNGLAVALFFHVVTCSFAWWVNPAYTKSWVGLVEAILWGQAGYAPSYLFLRNLALSTALFSFIFTWTANYLKVANKFSVKSTWVKDIRIG